jgi:hypothetical protein
VNKMDNEFLQECWHMDTERLKRIYEKHASKGCFMPWNEWEEKVRRAYVELLKRAKQVPYNQITMTYSELGRKIELYTQSDWFHLKIAWILYGCATYAYEQGYPLITALVVNSETQQPGKGFWGLQGIPSHLRKVTRVEDITPFKISGARDEFWVNELKRIDKWGKNLLKIQNRPA